MPISNECRRLFTEMLEKYEQLIHSPDKNFETLAAKLKIISMAITNNARAFKDDRVISYVSNSAVILGTDNPDFEAICKEFLISFQLQTHALDCLVDADLEIKEDLETWPFREMDETTDHPNQGLFFMDLQKALEARSLRMLLRGGIEASEQESTSSIVK